MLILLPPSEGKTSPTSGAVLNLPDLSFPGLTKPRERAIAAVQRLGDGPRAAATLGLGKKSAENATTNLGILSAPCTQAINLYTGVLYDHLDSVSLDQRARDRLESHTWISSALFGFVKPGDMIPNHRLSVSVKLPRLGTMGPWWRAQLAGCTEPELDVSTRTIFDARSGGYRAMFPAAEANVVGLTVVEERSGSRKVITHMAKKWRGIATRHLVEDSTLTSASSATDILASLTVMAAGRADQGVLGLEIGPAKSTKRGGSVTNATLVTASTE